MPAVDGSDVRDVGNTVLQCLLAGVSGTRLRSSTNNPEALVPARLTVDSLERCHH